MKIPGQRTVLSVNHGPWRPADCRCDHAAMVEFDSDSLTPVSQGVKKRYATKCLLLLLSLLVACLVVSLQAVALDMNTIFKNKQMKSVGPENTSKVFDKEGRYLRNARQGDTQKVKNDSNAHQGSARMPQK